MADLRLLALHGLAVKSAATPDAVADLLGQSPEDVQQALEAAVAEGHAIGAKGRFMVTPGGRAWLDESYPQAFAAHRDDPGFTTAADKFERINRDLLALLTDWQSIPAGGERVPNTHTDPDYDRAILDRLGDLHDRAAKVLQRFTAAEPRLEAYVGRLDAAYDRALAGEADYVSGVRVDSYHVAWHELHEDLLRMLGRTREE
ncbi:hypothetical protein [Blastococcus montanus]|uniref:hypothetical protein n=1 Tax=Blastococcus montanus TaxID=3144973 RepID=UPI0032092327